MESSGKRPRRSYAHLVCIGGVRWCLVLIWRQRDEVWAEESSDEVYEEPRRKPRQRERKVHIIISQVYNPCHRCGGRRQKMRFFKNASRSNRLLLPAEASIGQRSRASCGTASNVPAMCIHMMCVVMSCACSSKQCRERWVEYLNPDISRAAFSEEEDAALLELQREFGNHWKVLRESCGIKY